VLRPVGFGTALAAVVHRSAAPTVSQLDLVGGGEPALFANPVISTAMFFGGDSDSDLDSLGLQLVKRVTEIVAHGVHERGVVSLSLACAACVLKLGLRAWESGGTEEGGTLQGPWNSQRESLACRSAEELKIKRS